MKDRVLRRASAVVLGAMLLMIIPATSAFALATISSVSPSAEPANVTTDLQIHGSAFMTLFKPTVTFGTGIMVNTVNVDSGSQLTVNVTISPSAPTGFHVVTVDDGLGSPSSCSNCFSVTPPPTVMNISPSTIGLGAGTKHFTITGTNFMSGLTVAVRLPGGISGVSAANPAFVDATTMMVDLTVSPAAATGARDILVTNPDNQVATCSSCFAVTPPPHATANGFTPGQRAPGMTDQVIDVIGTGFAPGVTATFSGSGITVNNPLTYVSGSNLKMNITTAGNAPLGAQDVTFTNTDGGQSTCTACFAITGPTTVVIATPSTVNGDIVATFSQPVGGVSSTNSYVRYTGQTYNLATTITCANGTGFVVSCSGGNATKAFLHPSSLITPGQYYTVHVAAAGAPAVTDFGGMTVAEAMQDFRGGLVQQGEGAATTATWRVVKNARAFGSSYVVDHVAGATASYSFRGSSITWYTNIGPSYGIADLYVDGVLRATANSYHPTNAYRAAFTVSGFTSARHTLTIRVRGARGSSHGTGSDVAVDAFRTGRTTVASPTLIFAWGIVKASSASGGAYIRSDEPGSTASFTFRGTQIQWDSVRGPSMGRAYVYIDGVLKASTDDYFSTTQYGFARVLSGLSDSVHTIKVLVLGRHDAGATGSTIAIDRWVVT